MGAWVEEIITAFNALGGAARYDDLYEYIQRSTSRSLTTEWKATVRRTIEDHSSSSKDFRSHDYFVRHDHGFWGLRSAGDISALVNVRHNIPSKIIVDDAISKVFVKEHWRNWPTKNGDQDIKASLRESEFSIFDAWVSNTRIYFVLTGGIEISIPIYRFDSLKELQISDVRKIEVGRFGVYWPAIGFEVLLTDVFDLPKTSHTIERNK